MNAVSTTSLWDMAGRDGLSVARSLFGESVDHLAPFQSLETTLQGTPCAVLRLCDRNFRVTYAGDLPQLVQPLQANVWVRQLEWMGAIVLPDSEFPRIASQATIRPPHRLDLPLNCATPAQLKGMPVLLWRHRRGDSAVVELHLAQADMDAVLTLPAINQLPILEEV